MHNQGLQLSTPQQAFSGPIENVLCKLKAPYCRNSPSTPGITHTKFRQKEKHLTSSQDEIITDEILWTDALLAFEIHDVTPVHL